jgi:hypothetical protein
MIEILTTSGCNLIFLSLGMTLTALHSLSGNAFHPEYSNEKKI